jgi:hypothetical protein
MFSVHAPFDAKKANIETHRGRIDPKDAQRSPTYAAMIQSMDDAIGTLLDGLDRLNTGRQHDHHLHRRQRRQHVQRSRWHHAHQQPPAARWQGDDV